MHRRSQIIPEFRTDFRIQKYPLFPVMHGGQHAADKKGVGIAGQSLPELLFCFEI